MFKYSIHDKKILEEVEYLVNNNVAETKIIEYKSDINFNKEQIISTLLKPVCAFANSNDGYIIYGIKELSDNSLELTGVSLSGTPDETKLKIENCVRNYIEPQINDMDIAIHSYERNTNFIVIVIVRVKKSWYGPHREIKNNRFYGRNSAGTYHMDIAEIRNAFNLSSNFIDKIKEFVTKRLIDIEAGDTIVPMEMGAKLVLHIVPLSAYTVGYQNSVIELNRMAALWKPKVFRFNSWHPRVVLEGLIGKSSKTQHSNDRYDLLFRNGTIESLTIFPPRTDFNESLPHILPAEYSEKILIDDVQRFFSILKQLNYQTPLIIFISYLNIKNYYLIDNRTAFHKFDRDIIQLSSEVVETFDINVTQLLKPLFDSVWNCCGLLESENF